MRQACADGRPFRAGSATGALTRPPPVPGGRSGSHGLTSERQAREDAERQPREDAERVVDLQAELRHLADAGQWQAALAVDAELTCLDPSSSNPDGLAAEAAYQLAEICKRESRPAEAKPQSTAEIGIAAARQYRKCPLNWDDGSC